jgi:hypothetical protein
MSNVAVFTYKGSKPPCKELNIYRPFNTSEELSEVKTATEKTFGTPYKFEILRNVKLRQDGGLGFDSAEPAAKT